MALGSMIGAGDPYVGGQPTFCILRSCSLVVPLVSFKFRTFLLAKHAMSFFLVEALFPSAHLRLIPCSANSLFFTDSEHFRVEVRSHSLHLL